MSYHSGPIRILAALFLLATAVSAAPEAPASPQQRATVTESSLNLHAGLGLGLALMTSDQLTEVFDDRFGIGIGMHLSASATVGLGHYLQAEFRRGDSSHTLRDNDLVNNVTTEIPMDYDFTEVVAKLNLFALSAGGRANPAKALFLVVGKVDVDYLDEAGDGFRGDGTIVGLEIGRFGPSASASFGIRRYGLTFNEISLEDFTVLTELDASNWVLHTSFSIGLGL